MQKTTFLGIIGKTFWSLSLLLLLFLLILYIFQLALLTETMYRLKNYSQKIEVLSEENKNLEIKFSQSNSLENLHALVKNLNLMEVEKWHHIEIPQEAALAIPP